MKMAKPFDHERSQVGNPTHPPLPNERHKTEPHNVHFERENEEK
jgi:hypothetical protein